MIALLWKESQNVWTDGQLINLKRLWCGCGERQVCPTYSQNRQWCV